MPEEKKTRPMLRTKDVAHLLDCSQDDVIILARKRKLQAIKHGRFWRFREADVVAYRNRIEKLKGKES